MRIRLFTAVLMITAASAPALEIDTPEFGGQIFLDFLSFSQDSCYNQSGQLFAADNRYMVRKASIEASGTIGDNVCYEAVFGISSCTGSGTTASLKEVAVRLLPTNGENLSIGMGMIHVRRGFELGQDCGATLTAEKPMFRKVVSPSCHPLGAVMETAIDMNSAGGLEAQLFYGNGNSGTVNDEHDLNAALFYILPVGGLQAGGFYNLLKVELNPEKEGSEDAHRYGFGIDCETGDVSARAEFISVSGILPGMRPSGCTEPSEDVENSCIFTQAGYTFQTGLDIMPVVTSYISYEKWNRWSNADTGDYDFSWLTCGVKTCIGDPDTWLRIDYRLPASTPKELSEDASVLILRLGLLY